MVVPRIHYNCAIYCTCLLYFYKRYTSLFNNNIYFLQNFQTLFFGAVTKNFNKIKFFFGKARKETKIFSKL